MMFPSNPQRLVLISFILAMSTLIACSPSGVQSHTGWDTLPEILRNINPPTFPDRDFPVTEFGAKGDGTTDCTDAFRRAIEACSSTGGGRVVVPAGTFLTGAMRLRSNVNLHVSKDATIRFSTDPKKYLPVVHTRWEGVELMNYSPLVYAYGEENIAITGEGTLDGRASAENWWIWKGKKEYGWQEGLPNQDKARKILFEMGENNVPVEKRIFGEGHYLRPNFFQPYRCKNILVEGVTFKDSPMWFLHPVLSQNITIRGVTVVGLGPNNDGCNPESSTDVLIKETYFDTGDDCIAIKSGRNDEGRRIAVPSENIIVQNCVMKEGHGGVVVGSEMSGGVRNVFAERCTMDSPNLDRALRIKTNSVRGGFVENVYMRDITVGQVADAVILVDFYYEEGDAGAFDPRVRNINVRNLKSGKSPYALFMKGYERAPIVDLYLENCTFDDVSKPNVVEQTKNVQFVNVRLNGKEIHP